MQNSISEVGFLELGTSKPASGQVRSSKIGFRQVSVVEPGSIKNPFPHIGPDQSRTSQERFWHGDLLHEAINEVSTNQLNSFALRLKEVGSFQIGSIQSDTVENRFFKVSSSEIERNFQQEQITVAEVAVPKIKTELFVSSSIPLQQFLSSHNFNLQNTIIPTWAEFLTGTTPFNLNIEITDLPTGQLAEANITHFDPSGRPTSGTLCPASSFVS